ncbi:MAG: WhiB family transcriptional regulator [Pseudonocardiaceae bacterium]
MISVDCLAPDLQLPRLAPACWEVDPEVFYGPADSAEGDPVHTWERRALAVCAGCPLLATCRAEALEFAADEQFGVVGGMTAGQRRAALRGLRPGHRRARQTRRRGRDAFPILRTPRWSTGGSAASSGSGGVDRRPRRTRP